MGIYYLFSRLKLILFDRHAILCGIYIGLVGVGRSIKNIKINEIQVKEIKIYIEHNSQCLLHCVLAIEAIKCHRLGDLEETEI